MVDARIITSHSGHSLDAYIVLEEDGTPIGSQGRLDEIVESLELSLAATEASDAEVRRHVPRHLRHFPIRTQVNFYTDAPNQRTVLELITADRPGLLARIGRAFMDHGVRLLTAKIATLGERVEDVFFITDSVGLPFQDPELLSHLAATIQEQLDG